jgi:signal transduction histidine kinase/ActR/RegA family two-component response regulator
VGIRGKFLWAGLLGFAGLSATMEFVGAPLLLRGFEGLEAREARTHICRASSALQDFASSLERSAVDWGVWDEMYEFVRSPEQSFIDSNFDGDTLANLGLDRVLLRRKDGSALLHYRSVGRLAALKPIEPELLEQLLTHPNLWQIEKPDGSHRGLIELAGQLHVFGVSRVIQSDRSGPHLGELLFLRSLDSPLVTDLSKRTRLHIELSRTARERDEDPGAPLAGIAGSPLLEQLRFDARSEDLLAVERSLADAWGRPVADLRLLLPREIRAQALWTLDWWQVVFFVALLVSGALTMWGLRFMVLRRLAFLTSQARRFRDAPDRSERIALPGKDEFAELASTLSGMQDVLAARTDQLEHARVAAEAASQAKTEFLANMSHEIRTPLNAIIGFSELMIEGASSPEELEGWADLVHRNSLVLHDLIGDILDLTRIEAGHIELEMREFDCLQLFGDLEASHGALALRKGLFFELDIQALENPLVRSDSTRLRQILTNLVGNAIKFTDEGGVVVRAERTEGRGSEHLIVTVRDTGIGVPESKLGTIFESFEQADASTTRRYGGSGLGLAISAKLAELLGGRLSVSSEEGQGSCFELRLPVGQVRKAPVSFASKAASEELDLGPLQGLRVLLVEDSPDSAALAQMLLERAGMEVEWVENGALAIERCLDAEPGPSPIELVLMDMQMPVCSGLEATEQLRARGFETPIVALTANATEEAREACLAAGSNDYLQKPIRRRQLLDACLRWTANSEARAGR